MLFTDAHIVTAADLAKLESEITNIATVDVINVADVIQTAEDEFAQWLLMRMQSYSGEQVGPLALTGSLPGLYQQSTNRPRASLSQVVVTNSEYPSIWSPLKTLVAYECMAAFYREASSRRENDRFEEKREDFRSEVQKKYRHRFINAGVGLVSKPFYCPGSLLEAGAGTWSAAGNLSTVGSIAVSTPTFDVVITWIDSAFYQSAADKRNGESGPSAIATIAVDPTDQIRVSIANLVAPNGQARPSAQATIIVPPMNATGWNVYAGLHGGTLTRQNASVIPYATKTFDLQTTLLTTGEIVGYGQNAEYYLPLPNIAMRG